MRATVRGWLSLLQNDLVRLDAGGFRSSADVPDDVLGAAERLVQFTREVMQAGRPLSYGDELIDHVSGEVEAAERAWAEAQDALTDQQRLVRETRAAAEQLHRLLVAFREVLRAALGYSHRDYQKLRIERAAVSDPDDEVAQATQSDAAVPALGDRSSVDIGDGPIDPAPPAVGSPQVVVAPTFSKGTRGAFVAKQHAAV